MNQNTAYLDGSAVYGSTEAVARSLRLLSGGLMKATVIDGHYVLLPIDPGRRDCISDRQGSQCFVAGDIRVNLSPGLTVMHTIWLRLHNIYAQELGRLNAEWNDEKVYQETRRIVAALLQHITYNEYLPTVLGGNRLVTVATARWRVYFHLIAVINYSSLVKFMRNLLLPTDLLLKTENSKAFIYLRVRAIIYLKNELCTEMN